MLDALVSGTTDPVVLADLAKGRLRTKIPALQEALEGRFDQLHALWIGAILAHIDFLDEQIAALTEAIGEQIAPFEGPLSCCARSLAFNSAPPRYIIAEIGTDMTRVPDAPSTWPPGPAMCPGNDQSAGKRRSGKTRKGSKWLDWALEEAAMAAIRTKDVYLAAQYTRLRPRRGHKKAARRRQTLDPLRLLAHAHHRRALPRPRRRLLPKRDPERNTKRLVAQLERLGHTVTLRQAAAA